MFLNLNPRFLKSVDKNWYLSVPSGKTKNLLLLTLENCVHCTALKELITKIKEENNTLNIVYQIELSMFDEKNKEVDDHTIRNAVLDEVKLVNQMGHNQYPVLYEIERDLKLKLIPSEKMNYAELKKMIV